MFVGPKQVTDDVIGSKRRREDEERARIAENQQAAGSAYTAPSTEDLESSEPTGLPWGSVSIKHVLEAGKAREKQSQQASHEGSMAQGQGTSSKG